MGSHALYRLVGRAALIFARAGLRATASTRDGLGGPPSLLVNWRIVVPDENLAVIPEHLPQAEFAIEESFALVLGGRARGLTPLRR